MDAEDAGRRWRRLAQADQRAFFRLCRAGGRQLAQRGDRHRHRRRTRAPAPQPTWRRWERSQRGSTSRTTRSLPRGRWRRRGKAWAWAEKNPNVTFNNPPGISTGEYGDRSCRGRAAVGGGRALAHHRREAHYNDFFVQDMQSFCPSLDYAAAEGWNSLGVDGSVGLCVWGKRKGADRQGSGRDSSANRGGGARSGGAHPCQSLPCQHAGQGLCLGLEWRGGGVWDVSADCQSLPAGYRAFVDAARDNLHYLLGRNTFSLSWVTQLGEHPFEHPHHRPSGSGKQPGPWPGLLSGGPNQGPARCGSGSAAQGSAAGQSLCRSVGFVRKQ